MSKIDLGRKLDIEPMSISDLKDETHYPTLYIDDIDDKRLAEMPDSGTLVIHYKIRSRTHSERKEKNGKKHACSVTLDVTSIDPPPAKGKKKDADFGARKAISEYFKDK